MKKVFVLCGLALMSSVTFAQLGFGVKINLGAGRVYSQNLKDNIEFQNTADPKITQWSVTQDFGFTYGIGGVVSYNLSEKFSVLTEPSINWLKYGIDFQYVKDDRDNNGDGDIKSETNISDVRITYFSLPLLARLTFTDKRFALLAGLGVDFVSDPKIKSTATSVKEEYNNGVLTKRSNETPYTLDAKLDVFGSPRLSFVIGAGKVFDLNGKELILDLRYGFPITKSAMFTNESLYNDGHFKSNTLLSTYGKFEAETDAPGFILNDFKMSTITLSVSYLLFKAE